MPGTARVGSRGAQDAPLQETAADATAAIAELQERPRSYRALYEHWERSQWAVSSLDLSTDAASYAALGEQERRGVLWVFAHRFHAEFNVAALLGPLFTAAPSYEMKLLLAGQLADEYRHLEVVLRIYAEVLGVSGGVDAARAVADENIDPVASMFYAELEREVLRVQVDPSESTFLRAVLAYHLIAEGVIGVGANNLVGGQYDRHNFPGLADGQRRVALDEARHVGIGVTYARERLAVDPAAREVVRAVVDGWRAITLRALGMARQSLEGRLNDGYGVDAMAFYMEAAPLRRPAPLDRLRGVESRRM